MARITRENIVSIEARLNDALRRRNMDYRYRVVMEDNVYSIDRESPTHVHLDHSIFRGLKTRETFLILKGMFHAITENVVAETL